MNSAYSSQESTAPAQMPCAQVQVQLELFLDNECAADVRSRLAAHVRSCAHCARIAHAEMHLREIVRSRCAEQAPPALRARVLEQLELMRLNSQK